jgi:poly-gamma-glutamate synthesis protein (capsule biosynthesis protein)
LPVTFLGDIALPEAAKCDIKFDDDLVIANLEGPVSEAQRLGERVVYNCPATIEFLKASGINAVTLANNHIFDLGLDISLTERRLAESEIQFFGAGVDLKTASQPLVSQSDGVEVVVISAGWSVIGCVAARDSSPGVMPLDPPLLFRALAKAKTLNPDAKIIFYLHWNYELELYPQPAHRQLAFDLIHAGALAVIGAHSHCVQGVEKVGAGVVVHGLGNWMFPHNCFFNGKLCFPQFSSQQFSCHIDVRGDTHRLGWYEFENDSTIRRVGETDFDDAGLVRLTPYRGMSHEEYQRWFRLNRRKKKLLPVYADYRHRIRNGLKDQFVKLRAIAINKSVELGLKGGPK